MWDGLIDMTGTPVTMMDGKLNIPNDPIIHYIEGDGIGIDITPVMMKVVDAAVSKSYNGEKNIVWSEVLAGEKAFNATGEWPHVVKLGSKAHPYQSKWVCSRVRTQPSQPEEARKFRASPHKLACDAIADAIAQHR